MAPASYEGGREEHLMKMFSEKQQNMLLLLLLLFLQLPKMQPVPLLNKLPSVLLLLMDRLLLHKLLPPDKLFTLDKVWIAPLSCTRCHLPCFRHVWPTGARCTAPAPSLGQPRQERIRTS